MNSRDSIFSASRSIQDRMVNYHLRKFNTTVMIARINLLLFQYKNPSAKISRSFIVRSASCAEWERIFGQQLNLALLISQDILARLQVSSNVLIQGIASDYFATEIKTVYLFRLPNIPSLLMRFGRLLLSVVLCKGFSLNTVLCFCFPIIKTNTHPSSHPLSLCYRLALGYS